MPTHLGKTAQPQQHTLATTSTRDRRGEHMPPLADSRQVAAIQRKLQEYANNNPATRRLQALQCMADARPIQRIPVVQLLPKLETEADAQTYFAMGLPENPRIRYEDVCRLHQLCIDNKWDSLRVSVYRWLEIAVRGDNPHAAAPMAAGAIAPPKSDSEGEAPSASLIDMASSSHAASSSEPLPNAGTEVVAANLSSGNSVPSKNAAKKKRQKANKQKEKLGNTLQSDPTLTAHDQRDLALPQGLPLTPRLDSTPSGTPPRPDHKSAISVAEERKFNRSNMPSKTSAGRGNDTTSASPVDQRESDRQYRELIGEEDKLAERAAKAKRDKQKRAAISEERKKKSEPEIEPLKTSKPKSVAPKSVDAPIARLQQAPDDFLFLMFNVKPRELLENNPNYQRLAEWAGSGDNLKTLLTTHDLASPNNMEEQTACYIRIAGSGATVEQVRGWFEHLQGFPHLDDIADLLDITNDAGFTSILLQAAHSADAARRMLKYLGEDGINYLRGKLPEEVNAAVASCELDRGDHGHSVSSHGPQVPTAKHTSRVQTGLAPDQRRGTPPDISTSFDTFVGWQTDALAARTSLDNFKTNKLHPTESATVEMVLQGSGTGTGQKLDHPVTGVRTTRPVAGLRNVYTKFRVNGQLCTMLQHFPTNRRRFAPTAI